jgi:DNA-binding MarR family transcriptional regulator
MGREAAQKDDAKAGEERAEAPGVGMLPRAFALVRALASLQASGARVTQLAKTVGLTQGTTHRILRALIAEGMVEQDERSKLYRLGVDFFALAAQAGNPGGMRELCRPALLRLCASLGDTIFLLVKSSFDAVCLDMCEGPFPIRSITAETPPRVILTSNRTREVHDALKRRCLYHWIDYPTAQKEYEIVLAKVPEAPERLAREVVGFVHRLREADLTKVPGIAETLDWAAALLSLGAGELAPELVDETLGVVLKYEEDIRQVRGEGTRRYLSEAAAGG